MNYKDEIKIRDNRSNSEKTCTEYKSVAITEDARTARALGMRDLLRSLEMRELRERSGLRERSERAIYCNHSRRTARALGTRDLLQSLETN